MKLAMKLMMSGLVLAACTLPDVRVRPASESRERDAGPVPVDAGDKAERAEMSPAQAMEPPANMMRSAEAGGASGAKARAPTMAASGGSGGQPAKPAKTMGVADASTAGAGGAASSGVDAGYMDPTTICAGGKVGMDSDSSNPPALEKKDVFASVHYVVEPPNKIVSFKTTVLVPPKPTMVTTIISIYPQLQPRGGDGMLYAELTWGSYLGRTLDASWRALGMYMPGSMAGDAPGVGPAAVSGNAMNVEAGDRLYMDMTVSGGQWTQTITNLRTAMKVENTTDLKDQDQNWASWIVETHSDAVGGYKSEADSVFEKSVLTFADPVTSCQPTNALQPDYYTAPVLSPDGLHCCYERIVLEQMR